MDRTTNNSTRVKPRSKICRVWQKFKSSRVILKSMGEEMLEPQQAFLHCLIYTGARIKQTSIYSHRRVEGGGRVFASVQCLLGNASYPDIKRFRFHQLFLLDPE